MKSIDLREAAGCLIEASRKGTTLGQLPEACRPSSVADAYRIQETMIAAGGWHTVGWKVGATNEKARRLLGLSEPFSGRLLEHSCFSTGASLSLAGGRPALVEGEIAFRLGTRLAASEAPFDRARVAAAVSSLIPAIEVVSPRFADGLDAGGLATIADNGAHGAFISGDEHARWDAETLPDEAVSLIVDGETVAAGTPANVLGHPLDSLAWLANHAAARGEDLEPGELVTTGSCFGLAWAGPGDRVSVDFATFGTVSVDFTT